MGVLKYLAVIWGAVSGIPGQLTTLLERTATIIRNQETQMEQADQLKEAIDAANVKADKALAAQERQAVALVGIKGDVDKLTELIAGAGDGSLPAEKVAELRDLALQVSEKLDTVVTKAEAGAQAAEDLDAQTL